jgi:hypothetical protein
MNPYGDNIVAESRRADYATEAAAERLARTVRRRNRNPQAEPRPAPRQREVPRPAIA